MSVRILPGDALARLRELPDESIHCCITSPPYWGLRSYEGDSWAGGDASCDHKHPTQHQKQGATSARQGRANVEAQRNETFRDVCARCGAKRTGTMIGLEPTFDEHLERIVEVFREVRRVLRRDGTLWLNYGDAYASGMRTQYATDRKYGHARAHDSRPPTPDGLKPKDLMMMPARVALALQADGWWLRSEIVWHKPNPMPESCTDRPTSAHEKLYLFAKRATYFYDAEAVRVPYNPASIGRYDSPKQGTAINGHQPGRERTPENKSIAPNPAGANLRNVWSIPTESFPDAHFATFPTALVEPCIKAGTSERGCCAACGAPLVREIVAAAEMDMSRQQARRAVEIARAIGLTDEHLAAIRASGICDDSTAAPRGQLTSMSALAREAKQALGSYFREFTARRPTTTGWRPSCECAAETVPCTVLDPFGGAGTVGVVAQSLGRSAILIELSERYAAMARDRIERPHRPKMRPAREPGPLFLVG